MTNPKPYAMVQIVVEPEQYEEMIRQAMTNVHIKYDWSIAIDNPRTMPGNKTDVDFAMAVGRLLADLDEDLIMLVRMKINSNVYDSIGYKICLQKIGLKIIDLVYRDEKNERVH